MKAKVLVAGATGYLGKFVVKAFKEHGYWVRALARNPAKLKEQGPFLEPAVDHLIDDLYVGQVTKPETLNKLCQDIEIVYSSIGITRQRDGLTFRDVDYQGNLNILDVALKAGVRKFIFVSVFKAEEYEYLAVVKAREDFVKKLKNSGLEYAVVRPTGYFSDMSEFLRMAKSGRVFLIGDGSARMNPIHGADLAEVCVQAVEQNQTDIPVGGPQALSFREIAETAFRVLSKPPRISSIPLRLLKTMEKTVRPFSNMTADMLEFFSIAMTQGGIAPKFGNHMLADYYRELLRAWGK